MIRPAVSSDASDIWNLVATEGQKKGGAIEYENWLERWEKISKGGVYVVCKEPDSPALAVAIVARIPGAQTWVCRGEIIANTANHRRQLLGKIKDIARQFGAPVLEVGGETFTLNQGHGQQRGRGPA